MTLTQIYEDVLTEFETDGWISDVVQVLSSGKEGTVYCCRGGVRTDRELVAVKVYRPREHRTFRNDAVYQQGRWIPDKRLRKAVASKSGVGRQVQASGWVGHEFETLQLLHGAGAAVPEPLARSGQSLVMAYVGDIASPAPLLQHAEVPRADAEPLFRRLLREIEFWLACGRIHADLSPFNILLWRGEPTVIDFPQSVDPEVNPNAGNLLARDVANVCRFFARLGVRADAEMIAAGMWRRYLHRELRL